MQNNMDIDRARMVQLARKGYRCGQILVIMGLEIKGASNPDLVRAIDGLAMGCNEGSCTCGSLTGGCCFISLFAGKGGDREEKNENYQAMMKELVHWFWNTYGFKYGGIDCMAIRDDDLPGSAEQRCWNILESVYFKTLEILAVNGIKSGCEGSYAS
jgi:hypothetical protein